MYRRVRVQYPEVPGSQALQMLVGDGQGAEVDGLDRLDPLGRARHHKQRAGRARADQLQGGHDPGLRGDVQKDAATS